MARIIRIVWGTLINCAVTVSAAYVLGVGVLPYVEKKVEAQSHAAGRSVEHLTDQIYRLRAAARHLR